MSTARVLPSDEFPKVRPPLTPQQKRLRKRLVWGAVAAFFIHALLYFIAPRIMLPQAPSTPTEVVQISDAELQRLKNKILKQNKFLPPVLEQEMHEEFKTKEAPKDAKFMGKFNQKVPEETVAGAQNDAPLNGGGSKAKPRPPAQKPLKLADIGLKTALPKPLPPQTQGPRGPEGIFRPVGRDDKSLKRGNQNLLNTVESEYYSFFARFEEPLIRNWYFLSRSREGNIRRELAAKQAQAGEELPVTVQFTIDRQGRFLSIELLQTSGVRSFDEATREAVVKLGSLANPPEGIFEGRPTFTYHMTFTLVVTSGIGVSQPNVNWY